uniref:Uncharacterized protein n=1 Tax=Anguilla anguilla TaxID=7936 RepID=A0A0E9RE25_ANGAN
MRQSGASGDQLANQMPGTIRWLGPGICPECHGICNDIRTLA